MVKPTKFEVRLNKEPNNRYYAGEMMTGDVVLEVDSPMKVKGIFLTIEGVCGVEFHGRKGHIHKQKEKYFENKIYLYGKDRTDGSPGQSDNPEQSELQAGSHSLPFQWQVFPGLPSSIEGVLGHVRYSIKASIKQNWQLLADTVLKWFFVVSPLDLNTEPCAMLGDQGSASETYCCCCCTTAPIAAEFSIARRGYVAGDVMHMKAKINNYSRKNVKRFRVELFSVQSFCAEERHRKRRQMIKYIEKKFIAAGKEDKRDNMRMAVPELPTSHLNNCNLMEVDYRVQLTVTPDSCCGKDVTVPLEIIIGTTPHVGALSEQQDTEVIVTQPQSIQNLGMPVSQQHISSNQPQFVHPTQGTTNGHYSEFVHTNIQETRVQDFSDVKAHLPPPVYQTGLQASQTSNQQHAYNPQLHAAYAQMPQSSHQIPGAVPHHYTHPMTSYSSSMTPVEMPSFNTATTIQPTAPPMELEPPGYEESNSAWGPEIIPTEKHLNRQT